MKGRIIMEFLVIPEDLFSLESYYCRAFRCGAFSGCASFACSEFSADVSQDEKW